MKLVPVQEGQLSFKEWALSKYREIDKFINPIDSDGTIDPVKLNEILIGFSGHFAWAITMQEVESNELNRLQLEYDRWYKEAYNHAYRVIQQEVQGGRPPGQVTIDARIVDLHGDELIVRQNELHEQKSRVSLLKSFVKVLEKQASVLQTLSSNMRSELFFAGSTAVTGDASGIGKGISQDNTAAKALLRSAMRGQDLE
jgi:hypothetical protein